MADRGFIYILTDPRDGRVRYCGKTIKDLQQRLKDHLWTRPRAMHRPLYRWLDELLKDGQCAHISMCEEVSFDGLDRAKQIASIDAAERRWIRNYREAGADLLNLTDGGNGCHGRKVSDSHKAALSEKLTGRIYTAEQREHYRQGQLKRDKATYVRGDRHPNWKKPFECTDEAGRVAKIKSAWSPEKKDAHGARYRGANNVNATIDADRALLIFREAGSCADIARRTGTSYTVVWNIRGGKTWRHITMPLEE